MDVPGPDWERTASSQAAAASLTASIPAVGLAAPEEGRPVRDQGVLGDGSGTLATPTSGQAHWQSGWLGSRRGRPRRGCRQRVTVTVAHRAAAAGPWYSETVSRLGVTPGLPAGGPGVINGPGGT